MVKQNAGRKRICTDDFLLIRKRGTIGINSSGRLKNGQEPIHCAVVGYTVAFVPEPENDKKHEQVK